MYKLKIDKIKRKRKICLYMLGDLEIFVFKDENICINIMGIE